MHRDGRYSKSQSSCFYEVGTTLSYFGDRVEMGVPQMQGLTKAEYWRMQVPEFPRTDSMVCQVY